MSNLEKLMGPTGIDSENILAKKFFGDNISWMQARTFQPVLFCHDQEPLNYNLYEDGSPAVECLRQETDINGQLNYPYPLIDLNLRCRVPWSYQTKWILLHSEKNSLELKKYENTGRYQGAFWWSHAMISLDWYRYAQHDLSLHFSTHKKLFLIYARAFDGTRTYRRKFLDLIDPLKHNCQIGSYDTKFASPDQSAVYQAEDFINTDISIVLETLFEDQRIHLTEKILRPVACGHPFILAAGPGSLDFLRSYGFETFSPWINEKYDTISCHENRLESIVSEMRRINNLDESQRTKIIQECKKIALKNQQHFFSKNFQNQIIQELKENVKTAWASCHDNLNFDFYLKTQKWKKINGVPKNQMIRKVMIPLIRHVRKHNGSFEQYQSHQHSLDDKSSTDGNNV